MNFLDTVFPKAQAANKRLVLPEGHDPRVVIAAAKIKAQKIATPVVLATPEELAAAEAQAGVSLKDAGVEVLDYTKAPIASELIAAFYAELFIAVIPERNIRILEFWMMLKYILSEDSFSSSCNSSHVIECYATAHCCHWVTLEVKIWHRIHNEWIIAIFFLHSDILFTDTSDDSIYHLFFWHGF